MFPFLRFSAVMASIVVASTAFGFGLGNALSLSENCGNSLSMSGISVASSVTIKQIDRKSRSLLGLRDLSFDYTRLDTGNVPAINAEGPRPGSEHVDLGSACNVTSSCLVAMN